MLAEKDASRPPSSARGNTVTRVTPVSRKFTSTNSLLPSLLTLLAREYGEVTEFSRNSSSHSPPETSVEVFGLNVVEVPNTLRDLPHFGPECFLTSIISNFATEGLAVAINPRSVRLRIRRLLSVRVTPTKETRGEFPPDERGTLYYSQDNVFN